MDVSVVIISYNVSSFIDECLLSIKKETICKYEIIIVDNNSEDDSVEIIRTRHPDVKLIQNESNRGFAAANNIAFRQAQGRFIFMLNPDTVILDRAIDKLVLFMDKHPEVAACGPKNLNPDLTLQRNCHHFPSLSMYLIRYSQLERFFPENKYFGRSHMTYWDYDRIREVDWITGCSLLFRKELLDKVGYLDEKYFMYSEECDFCYRIKKNKMITIFYPGASIIHFGGRSSLKRNNKSVQSRNCIENLFRSRYYFFKKNYGIGKEFLLRILDIIYFGVVFLKNKIHFSKRNRQDTINLAKIALRSAVNHAKN